MYSINKRNRLTSKQVSSAMESYDLGCSYRGGPDTDSVFTHAGLSFISSGPHSANIHGCESHYSRRARRSVDLRHELVTMKWNLSAELQECCVQGFSPILMKRSCEERQRRVSEMSTLDQCAEVFYNCCLRGEALRKVAAQDNGFSRRFCVAEPYKLTAMKDIFVSLRLPYSLAAHMEQVPGLCSPGSVTLAAFVNVSVAPESSELVTFAAVPMTNGDIPIKIRLYDITKGRETDAVEKSLNVWTVGAEQNVDYPALVFKGSTTFKIDGHLPDERVPGSASNIFVKMEGEGFGASSA
ncbi:hypothetical protein CRUP_001338, partial [Coryphaenoides rupestris]